MQLNPLIPPQAMKLVQPQVPPATQVALSPAVMAAQQTTTVQRTQTIQAPQAAGKADGTRDAKSGTDTGQALDTNARAVQARTNGRPLPGSKPRGSLLDVSV